MLLPEKTMFSIALSESVDCIEQLLSKWDVELISRRQIDVEDCPLPRIGVDEYMASMIPDDRVRDRKPHTAPVRLGGEIGIEYFLNVRPGDTGAAVAHRDFYIPTSGQ